jgi:hypothetical protein
MGGINLGWLAVWVPSPDWLCRTQGERFYGRLSEAAAPGGGSAGRAPTFHRIPWHFPYNWGKSRKTSIRVTECRSAVKRRSQFVLSTWPSQSKASTGLLSTVALGFRTRWQCEPSVRVSICRFVVLGVPHFSKLWVKALGQGSGVVGKKRNSQILVYLPVTYVPKATSCEAKTLGL